MSGDSEPTTSCQKCRSNNPASNNFCGNCGAAFDSVTRAVGAYLDANLNSRIDDAIAAKFRDKQVVETDLAMSVAEKMAGWAKTLGVLVGIPFAIITVLLAFMGISFKDEVSKDVAAVHTLQKQTMDDLTNSQAHVEKVKKAVADSEASVASIQKDEDDLKSQVASSKQQLALLPGVADRLVQLDQQESHRSSNGPNLMPLFIQQGKAVGIDITHSDDHLDWSQLKSAGISFVYLKATTGVSGRDDTFMQRRPSAKNAGLMTGAYHFLTASDVNSQVVNFINSMSLSRGDLPPAVVYETVPGNQPTLEILKTFLRLVAMKTGCTPVIYSGEKLKSDIGADQDPELAKYPLWIAHYGKEPPRIPSTWKSWTFWQFTDGGSVNGLPPTDVNGYNGTLEDLKAFAKNSCPSL